MNKFTIRFILAAALLMLAVPAMAQTALTTTTISGAVADVAQRTIVVASATGISIGHGIWLPATGEFVTVTGISGTTLTVNRGDEGSRALPIANSATAVITPPNASINRTLFGSCTGANAPQYFQYVNVPQNLLYVCLSGAGTWQARQGTPVVYNHTLVITR